MSLQSSASQTVGPFFHLGLNYLRRDNLLVPGIDGLKIAIRGRVLDGDAVPVPDALVEIWQADAEGRYSSEPAGMGNSAAFKGFGRVATDKNGAFSFVTIKPGRVSGPAGILQAPHIVITVFARGLLKQLVTRLYFPDEPSNAEDTVLNLVPAERRVTLIAARVAGETNAFEWNLILQGRDETVFFDW